MCETITKIIIILFFQLEPEVLHKSKEPPNTGTYYISLSSSFLFLMYRDLASSVVFGKRKALGKPSLRTQVGYG